MKCQNSRVKIIVSAAQQARRIYLHQKLLPTSPTIGFLNQIHSVPFSSFKSRNNIDELTLASDCHNENLCKITFSMCLDQISLQFQSHKVDCTIHKHYCKKVPFLYGANSCVYYLLYFKPATLS